MPDQQGADDKKTTKEVVNKKQKQMMGEEGYDVARDEGRVSPAKDKKDATTAPRKGMTAKERKKAMQQAQQRSQIAVNNVVTALRKKYGKDAVMYTQKTSKVKSNEELDLTQVAEAFGGYVIDENKILDNIRKFGGRLSSVVRTGLKSKKVTGKQTRAEIKKDDPSATFTPKKSKAARDIEATGDIFGRNPTGDATVEIEQPKKGRGRRKVTKQIPKDQIGVAPGEKPRPVKTFKSQGQLDAYNRAKKFRQTDAGAKAKRIMQNKKVANVADTGDSIAKTTFNKFRDAGSQAKKIATSVQAPKVGKAGAEIADMSKTAVGKVRSGLSVGNLKTVGKTAGKKLFGKGGALAAKTIGRAGAKFGAKRIYGVGSAIAGAEAIGRFAAGDVVGGTLAGAEAITGLIPGIGTGVSAGLGALGLARDLKRTKQVVGAVRKAKNLRKLKPVTRGLVGKKSNLNRFVKGAVKPQNRTSTAVGLTGAGAVGSTVSDRRRNRLRLPSIPSPTLTGGSAGFRTAG